MVSCNVNKNLLGSLENYLNNEVELPNPEDTKKCLSLSIEDGFGTEIISSINDYAPQGFMDSISRVRLMGCYCSNGKELLKVTISFGKDRLYSQLSISSNLNKAREIAMGIYERISRLCEPNKNSNWIYNPKISIGALLFGLMFGSLSIIPIFFYQVSPVWKFFIIFIVCCLVIYNTILKRLKPYCAFDSGAQHRADRFANWFFYGVLSFGVFGILFTFFRRSLLGF